MHWLRLELWVEYLHYLFCNFQTQETIYLVNVTTLASVFMIRSYAEKKAESPQEPSDSWLLRIHCTVDGNWGPLPPSSLETKATQAVSYAHMLSSPSFIDLSIALISSMRGSMLVPWLWWTLNGRSQWQFNKLLKSLCCTHKTVIRSW